MRWVTTHLKELLIREKADEIMLLRPGGFEESITQRAVHELLFQPSPGNVVPFFPALLAARAAVTRNAPMALSSKALRKVAWVDSTDTFYPPAAMGAEMMPEQMWVLQPRPADLVWTTIELLRCRSIGAVVAPMMRPLSRVEVRRLQLAAETGGGVAVLIRPNLPGAASHVYAAATRWLVTPAPGERTIQRWHLQLVHGHGWQNGQSFILEKHRATGQTHFVRSPASLVDHPAISAAS